MDSHDGRDGRLELTTRDGKDLEVPVSTTWIELVPKDTGKLSYGT